MKGLFLAVAAVGLAVLGGCMDADGSTDDSVAKESGAVTTPTTPTTTTPTYPSVCPSNPVCPINSALPCLKYFCNTTSAFRYVKSDCKHMAVIHGPGSTDSRYRSYGVCTSPERIEWQMEGRRTVDFSVMNARIAADMMEQADYVCDFTMSGGGVIPKGGGPVGPGPGGTDPLASWLKNYAHDLHGNVQIAIDVSPFPSGTVCSAPPVIVTGP